MVFASTSHLLAFLSLVVGLFATQVSLADFEADEAESQMIHENSAPADESGQSSEVDQSEELAVSDQDTHFDHYPLLYGHQASATDSDRYFDDLAAQFGRETESAIYQSSELDPVVTLFGGVEVGEQNRIYLGYMRDGMSSQLSASIVANAQIDAVYKRHAGLRDRSGVDLPREFNRIINYIRGYIEENDAANAVQENGMSHRSLALQIVRASFCFGNDPLMIASKMRRETSFSRSAVSPTGAVGFSQMTGPGIAEVRDQMDPDARRTDRRGRVSVIAMSNARSEFIQAIRCFTGLSPSEYTFPTGTNEQIKQRLRRSWTWDMIFGQIMTKTLVSYNKSSGEFPNTMSGNKEAYRATFAMYNGDATATQGVCLKQRSVKMHDEYACSIISHFERMSAQLNRFAARESGRDLASNTCDPQSRTKRIM